MSSYSRAAPESVPLPFRSGLSVLVCAAVSEGSPGVFTGRGDTSGAVLGGKSSAETRGYLAAISGSDCGSLFAFGSIWGRTEGMDGLDGTSFSSFSKLAT